MSSGWVKLHRRMLDWEWFGHGPTVRLFLWCLLRANHASAKVAVAGSSVSLNPGQFIAGRISACRETGLSESEIRTARVNLCRDQAITWDYRPDLNASIVSVLNWEKYQEEEVSQSETKNYTRQRDAIWDSVCSIFGLKPVTKSERSRVGKIVRDLKLKEATPEKIERAYQQHGYTWPKIQPITPESVTKHWDMLTSEKPREISGGDLERMNAARSAQ
jgi:hypothetical protein